MAEKQGETDVFQCYDIISAIIFSRTIEHLVFVLNKGLKIKGRKNQTGYLLFELCVPNLLIRYLLSELFCVHYI